MTGDWFGVRAWVAWGVVIWFERPQRDMLIGGSLEMVDGAYLWQVGGMFAFDQLVSRT